MFDKKLFLSLCENYDVELSETASSPMIKDDKGIHIITSDDITRVFAPYQTYFRYSCNRIDTKVALPAFYLQDDYATAC